MSNLSEKQIEKIRSDFRRALLTGDSHSIVDKATERLVANEKYLDTGLKMILPAFFELELRVQNEEWSKVRIIVEKVISRLADAELIKKYRNLSQVETENLSELNELDVFSEEIIKLMKHHILTIFKSIDKTNLGEMNFSIDLISAWVKTAVIEMQKDIDVDTIIKNTSSLVYDSSHADCLINSVRKDREVKEIDGQLYVPIDVVHDALNESARQLLTITREIRKIDKNDAKIAAEKLRAIRDEAQKVVFASSMQNSLEKVRRAIDSATAFLDEIS